MDELEAADVVILMFDYFHLTGKDLADAVRRKMAINRNRTWYIDPKTGIMHHIKTDKS